MQDVLRFAIGKNVNFVMAWICTWSKQLSMPRVLTPKLMPLHRSVHLIDDQWQESLWVFGLTGIQGSYAEFCSSMKYGILYCQHFDFCIMVQNLITLLITHYSTQWFRIHFMAFIFYSLWHAINMSPTCYWKF